MSGQIIEIQSDNRHLSCERGFMTVSSEGQVVAKIPMSDVEAVITASHGISYSNNLYWYVWPRRIFRLCFVTKNFFRSVFYGLLPGSIVRRE